MKIFKDRKSAGELLAKRLKSAKADMVLAVPRGGVVVAAQIARQLKLPLDIVVVRKIGAPFQEELALGAIDADGEVVWDNEMLAVQLKDAKKELVETIKKEWKELKRREDAYRGGRGILNIDSQTIILVDDGIATGATALAAVKYLQRHKAKIILAVPVVSKDALEKIVPQLGEGSVVVLEIPEYFQAVGQFYQHFLPVSDQEVVKLLDTNG